MAKHPTPWESMYDLKTCTKTKRELRVEYNNGRLEGFCSGCLAFHELCLNQKNMMVCYRSPGHEGKHAYEIRSGEWEEWE